MEERNDIIGYASYEQYKTALKTELQREAEGFVRIGYLLKVARDTSILKDSGYATVNEFAAAEFDLDASQVSRFMNINDRFSEGGYSERLEERFRGIGYAKLSLMLTLPDAINAEITENFSKSEIQAIKDEVEAEKQLTDLEVMLEGEEPKQKEMSTLLQKAIHQLGYEQPELYVKMHNLLYGNIGWHAEDSREKRTHETMAPTGEAIFSIRLLGIGRLLLSIKEPGGNVTLTNIRSNDKETYSWEELEQAWDWIIDAGDAKANWALMYSEAFPEKKEEIAPVQVSKTPVKKEEPAKRKQSKVTKAAPEKKKPAAVVPKVEESETATKNDCKEEMQSEVVAEIETDNVENETVPDVIDTETTEIETETDINERLQDLQTNEANFEDLRIVAEGAASRILSALVRLKWSEEPSKEEYEKILKENMILTGTLEKMGGKINE